MWQRDVLEDACTYISRGISPKYTEEGGVLVINQKCVRNHSIDYSLARRHDIEKKNVKPERFIQKGDVLINSTGQGTLGRVAQVREEPPELTTVDSHVTIVRPNLEKFYLDYFGYALIQIEDGLKKSGQGTSGQTELAKTKVQKEFFASYPNDRQEQQRIVAKLDAAFAEIDRAVELVEAKQVNAERLKVSLLGSSLKGVDATWKTVTLGDALRIARGGSPRPIKSFITDTDDGINWIKIGDSTQGGRYIESTKEKIKPSGISRSRYVKSGDFLLSNSMSFGRPYILKTDGCIHDGWLVLSNYEEIFTSDYLYYLLSSAVVQNQFEELARGSTVRNLNTELVSSVVVSLPPLAEQQRIVAKLDAAFAEIDTVFATTTLAKENYLALKASILAEELSPSEAA